MAELRVDPAHVGPRIAVALQSAAAALAVPAAIAPPLPAGADPVSAAAAGRVATNAATLSGHLAAGITRLAQGAAAVTKALSGYVTTDAAGAALIDGHAAAAAAETVAAIAIPAIPAIEIPSVPVDAAAALASLPGDPAIIDDALHTGAAESGLHAHAAAWDSAASQLHTAATEMRMLGASLPSGWSGPAADNLTTRLGTFSDWLTSSAQSARAHADTTRQAATMYRSAVNAHPRATDVRNTQQALMAAMRRAAAGDPTAVPVALDEEAKLAQMKQQSVTAMTQYGQGAGGLSPAATPGDSPQIGDGDPRLPDKPADGVESADDASGDDLEAALLDGESLDDPQALDGLSGSPDQLSQTAGQSMQQMLGTMTQMPSQMAQAVGQALNSSGQQLGQVGQQASQAVSQLGQVLGGSPLGGAGRVAASSAGVGDAGSGLLDALGGGGAGGAGDLGSGLGDLGAGAGDFGAGTVPAGLPEQLPPPSGAAAAAQTATTTSVPRSPGPTMAGGMAGGMPMGMMPMAGRGAGDGNKELARNPDWFPDEALVKDEPEVSEAVAGQRRRPRPTQT